MKTRKSLLGSCVKSNCRILENGAGKRKAWEATTIHAWSLLLGKRIKRDCRNVSHADRAPANPKQT